MARAVASKVTAEARVDPAAILGLVAGLGLIAVAIAMGGSPAAFVDLPAMMIVLGGTVAVTMMSFPLDELRHVPRTVAAAMSLRRQPSAGTVARDCLELAELARRSTVLVLERKLAALADRPVLRSGIVQVLESVSPPVIEATLRRELAADAERRARAQSVLRRAADVAPAMGLIGTLIGLVQMLGQLEDPSAIGPAMAVALLTTFYGALLSHAVLMPMAERLANLADRALLHGELELAGVLAIAGRENPRRLEANLNGLLGPNERLDSYA